MSSDLAMTVFAGGAVFKIDAAEDGIFAVACADLEYGLLGLFFATLVVTVDGLLMFKVGVIGK